MRVRRRGGRELREEKARASGAEPGENLSVFVLTLTLTVKVFKTCNKLVQPLTEAAILLVTVR